MGCLVKAKTGVAWRDLPERCGPWKTVYNRFWRSIPASCGRISTLPAPAA
ncbi:transposase [Amycolatopsis sp. NPDC006125]